MAPGKGGCKDDGENHQKIVSHTDEEKNNTHTKPMITWKEKQGNSLIKLIKVMNDLLHCPVCECLTNPPIQQCPKGHTLCVDCKNRANNSCPTCGIKLEEIRCLALEKAASLFEFPCKYQNLGCLDRHPYYSKARHELHCQYRPYRCPYAGSECFVTGDIPTLVSHLKDDHRVDMHHGSTFSHRYIITNPLELENATWKLTVFNCYEKQFCLHFEAFMLEGAPVYMAFLRIMGEETEARKFKYTLAVGGDGRKLVWEGVPRSIRHSHKIVMDSQDGLIIPRSSALLFSGGDSKELKLRVTGKIWKL